MFRNRFRARLLPLATEQATKPGFAFEGLEDRRLLSASHQFGGGGGGGGNLQSWPGGRDHGGGQQVSTITVSQAPAAVVSGLDALALTDGVTAPAATQTVSVSNAGGVEAYSVAINGTGTRTVLTVDSSGNPVTAPTQSSTTFGANTNTAVTTEIGTIATALGLTAPSSTSDVQVSTPADSTDSTYSIHLESSSSSSSDSHRNFGGTTISIDSNGDPVGDASLPFSVFSSTIQSGLNALAPSGSKALASTSTQNVQVRTVDGITTYSTTFTPSGTQTTVTVDAGGNTVTLQSQSTVDFDTLPAATQTELQTVATADGVTAAISTTQSVTAYGEANGTTVYRVVLAATKTSESGSTYTVKLMLSADENGNPTVAPEQAGEGFAGAVGGSFQDYGFGFGPRPF